MAITTFNNFVIPGCVRAVPVCSVIDKDKSLTIFHECVIKVEASMTHTRTTPKDRAGARR